MSFTSDVVRFEAKMLQRVRAHFLACATAMHDSIRHGDLDTTAPGQPVDEAELLNSWSLTFPEPWVAQSSTNAAHARTAEEGQQAPYTRADGTQVVPGPWVNRSPVGGSHSVALTRVHMDKIVEREARRVKGVG